MAGNTTTFIVRGHLVYAKVLGAPVLNYNKDGKEWTFDFVPLDPEKLESQLEEVGIEDRLRKKSKTKYPVMDGRPYMSFKQKELKANGEPNQPIKVVDAANKPWDNNRLLGNETVADVKFVVVDNGPNKYKGVYPRGIRVLDLVPYEASEFDDIAEDDEYASAAKEAAAAAKEFEDFADEQEEPAPTKKKATKKSPVTEEDDLDDDLPWDDEEEVA